MHSYSATFLLFLLLLHVIPVQSVDVPVSWRKPNITASWNERIDRASIAIQKVLDMLDGNLTVQGSVDAAATLHALLPQLDHAAKQTNYKDKMYEFFTRYPTASIMAKSLKMFGLTAVWAYTTYQDPQFLSVAKDSWSSARNYTWLKEDLLSANKSIKLNYDHLQQQCDGGDAFLPALSKIKLNLV
ncbi:hypothetical protein VNI00_015125 [Paramarasmius palmivorus]|uniref:Uncharacterized protein n=1 Tax=Paramarasmius palmivorus TaxID=297713 RepID=A0AAW0BPQ7_9AGAR